MILMTQPETAAAPRRPVRSFVLREGRLTAGQARAFENLWPHFGVDRQPDAVLDLPALFGNDRPVVLEIGFGNGESLAAMAAAYLYHIAQNHPFQDGNKRAGAMAAMLGGALGDAGKGEKGGE